MCCTILVFLSGSAFGFVCGAYALGYLVKLEVTRLRERVKNMEAKIQETSGK